MINVFKSFVNAFAEYSFMPLPFYEDEGDRYKYIFVPLIGSVISVISYVWFLIGWHSRFNDVSIALGVLLVAGIVTGGRHILGFIDYIDGIPTYKYRFKTWKDSSHRGVFRFIVALSMWFIAMLNTYNYMFPLLFAGFVFSRIYMGLLSSLFNESTNQSRWTVAILIIGYVILNIMLYLEFEHLVICPILFTFFTFLGYIIKFRKTTDEMLPLLEDDYIITSETAWIFSSAMVSFILSL